VSPTTAADVRADLGGDVDLVLDGGRCRVGIESTIVDCTGPGPAILREGGVPRRRVEALLGTTVPLRTRGEVAAPGTLASHYAPRARVELTDRAEIDQRATAALARGERVGVIGVPPVDARVVGLGEPADAERYAHDLYAMLRAADACELDLVLAVVPSGTGLAAAVADRLRRAAGGAA
jgi:L-threonylcarbamoyladenylate synthase